ncbi:MAG: class I SAM-dependent methyltransferase [Rhodospirillales bacterium]|nr:class I SAM-dependent methyltransferase [Rhodospirillales bacterium]
MADFHFVEDYERHVAHLLSQHPLDEAMSLAVGGNYDHVGSIECAVLKAFGLVDGMSVIDLGCGSGRLAHALGKELAIDYLGIDIIEALLDYAKTKTPANFKFVMHRELSIPANDTSADIICAFSVFTHLLHTESYIYLEEMRRALKPGGLIIFSFLEFAAPEHWAVFESTLAVQRSGTAPHLNIFIERNAIDCWSEHLGLQREAFIDASDARWEGHHLGQSVAVLRKVEDE